MGLRRDSRIHSRAVTFNVALSADFGSRHQLTPTHEGEEEKMVLTIDKSAQGHFKKG